MMASDEDLEYVKEQLGIGASEYAKVDAVISELIALRQVAASADALMERIAISDSGGIPDTSEYEALGLALKAAGW